MITYPVQYDRQNNRYIYNDRIDAELSFNDSAPVNPVLSDVRRNRSREFLNFIRALAVNGEDLGRDDGSV